MRSIILVTTLVAAFASTTTSADIPKDAIVYEGPGNYNEVLSYRSNNRGRSAYKRSVDERDRVFGRTRTIEGEDSYKNNRRRYNDDRGYRKGPVRKRNRRFGGFRSNILADSYITVEGTSISVEDNLDGDLNPLGLRFRIGAPVANFIDLEAHFGFGRDSNTSAFGDFDTSYGGLFLKGHLPLGSRSSFYGLAGIGGVALSQTINGSEFTEERAGFSFGGGFETQISRNAGITADFVSYVRDDGLFENVSAISLGIKLYF